LGVCRARNWGKKIVTINNNKKALLPACPTPLWEDQGSPAAQSCWASRRATRRGLGRQRLSLPVPCGPTKTAIVIDKGRKHVK